MNYINCQTKEDGNTPGSRLSEEPQPLNFSDDAKTPTKTARDEMKRHHEEQLNRDQDPPGWRVNPQLRHAHVLLILFRFFFLLLTMSLAACHCTAERRERRERVFHWGRFASTRKFSSSSRNWLSCHYVALELVQLCLLLRLLFLLLSRRQRVREEEGDRGVVVSGLTHDGLARRHPGARARLVLHPRRRPRCVSELHWPHPCRRRPLSPWGIVCPHGPTSSTADEPALW